MTTLTEFVLARIAEDEGFARHVWPERFTDRMLAECDAKRQLVEDYETLNADLRVTRSEETKARRFQSLVAIARAAAVYADHPDYRDEWRP